MKQVRKRLTYANVMSSLAVFMVLGGGAAVAANGLGKNSVGTPQIKRNAVKVGKLAPEAVKAGKLAKNAVPTNRLRDNAVSAGKIANGSVLTDKLADESVTSSKLAKDSVLTDKILNNAVTSEKIANDAVTTAKIAGEAVTTGKLANSSVETTKLAAGSVRGGKLGTLIRRGTLIKVPNNTSRLGSASCQAGERVLSGGGAWVGVGDGTNTTQMHVVHSFPAGGVASWSTRMFNGSGVEQEFNAYAVCLQAG